jgi:hypothetical protein
MKKYIITFCLCLVFKITYSQKANNYVLLPFRTNVTIPTNAKLNFEIGAINESGKIETVVSDINTSAVWTINGQPLNPAYGKLDLNPLNKTKATYTAPEKVPPRNPVAVSVSFIEDDDKKTRITLVCNVTVANLNNYFYLENKGLYQLDDIYLGAMESKVALAVEQEGQLVISVNGTSKGAADSHLTSIMSMNVMLDMSGMVEHPWKTTEGGKGSSTVTLSYTNDEGKHFTFGSGDCLPHGSGSCQTVSLQGTTYLFQYNKQTGVVQGTFYGTLMTANPVGTTVQYEYENAYGKFTAHMIN